MMTPDPCPFRGPRCSKGPDGPSVRGPNGFPKNSSIRSRSSSGTENPSETFSVITVVMLTTAGVTCLATSVKPFVGAFTATGIAAGDDASAAWDAVSEWLPQTRATLRRPIPIAEPMVRYDCDDIIYFLLVKLLI